MSFRTRLLAFYLPATLLPILVLALLIRNEMTAQMADQYRQQVGAVGNIVTQDVARQSRRIERALTRLGGSLADDNRFRRAAVDGSPANRRYVIDYAGKAMDMMGLDALQIQDEAGRILSSGHFRNEYNRLEKRLPGLLSGVSGENAALVSMRSPEGPFLAFARVDSIRISGKWFTMIGGMRVEGSFVSRLERGEDLTVRLVYPGGILTADTVRTDAIDEAFASTEGPLVSEVPLPFIGAERRGVATARLQISHARTALLALRSRMDLWFIIVAAIAAMLAVVLTATLAGSISRPLAELAEKTSRLDLERMNLTFRSDRKDEIGRLTRFLGEMTRRLRAGALKIKDAERRATVGELARQVNHDIKNGLIPIRNVFRHLTQVAENEPEHLPEILGERQATLEAGIAYLENLAANYARITPVSNRQPCSVHDLIRRLARDLDGLRGVRVRADLEGRGVVYGDPVALRRILENVIDNALDSFTTTLGTVIIATRPHKDESGRAMLRVRVTDDGPGMSDAQRAHVFDDFFTTKPDGTGLGLSIVRRLVIDLDGRIRVESAPGKGSSFSIDLPVSAHVDG